MSKVEMRPAHIVEIETPKKYSLNGLWFGPKKPTRVIIFVHGFTGSLFSMRHVRDALLDSNTAFLAFNNRGFGNVNSVKRKAGKKLRSVTAGAAHEVFTDCVDDIDGAVTFARKTGARNIYIAGHSTGCQKAAYWASKNKNTGKVRGLIFLGPVSDYADAVKNHKKQDLRRATRYAKKLILAGRKHELLPASILGRWSLSDAQRFVSLYTPDSVETIFCYEQKDKIPQTLYRVQLPILVLWAEKDEYADRPAKEIAAWFENNIRAPHSVVVVPRVTHSFKGGEGITAGAIRKFMK